MMKNTKGITLVALVITIIILLILAGISIQALTQTNLFDKTKQAKNAMENAQNQENEILSSYMEEINEYLSNENDGIKLSKKVKVGDYVNYIPDTLNETELTTLKNNLNTYSGIVNDENNTINPIIKRDELKWRVLDINEKTGEPRLISAKPTDSQIQLYSYNGYNNAVKLIDDACYTLYNNKTLASKVQNLKIEDVTTYMTTQPTEDVTEYKPTNIKIPNILKQEENQTVEGSITNKIGLSEQKEFVTGSTQLDSGTFKNTYWHQEMNPETSFKGKIYYELFIKKYENYYSTYWMSSRCIDASSIQSIFDVCIIGAGGVHANDLYYSLGSEISYVCAFRPVITLNSNVQIDTSNPGDGTENNGYNIK